MQAGAQGAGLVPAGGAALVEGAGVERAGLFWYDANTDRFRSIRNWPSAHTDATKSPIAVSATELDLLWQTMRHATETLEALGIGFESRIVSAHRTPDRLVAFAKGARAAGFQVIVAGAGGAAHLPGMAAAMTPLPVFGVPVESRALSGQDSLLSIVQMPAGIPVGTLAIGRAGAVNAALLAAAVLALTDDALAARLDAWRAAQTAAVAERPETEHP